MSRDVTVQYTRATISRELIITVQRALRCRVEFACIGTVSWQPVHSCRWQVVARQKLDLVNWFVTDTVSGPDKPTNKNAFLFHCCRSRGRRGISI